MELTLAFSVNVVEEEPRMVGVICSVEKVVSVVLDVPEEVEEILTVP